ncbi:MAG: zinc finger Ran-binding domain-containing protein [Pyrinomonadaceae bacterium]
MVTTTMSNPKCAGCGLVNFADASECKRCGAALGDGDGAHAAPGAPEASAESFETRATSFEDSEEFEEVNARRGLLTRVAWILTVTCAVIVAWHGSLLLTSEAASMNQRLQVRGAVDVIERGGFSRETFLLRRLTCFRTTDNWWNTAVGHGEAYAATNFPFEVVTLYPEFFKYPTDDTERAVILLHEARHLAGAGEEEALKSVWRDKARLGWTSEKYSETRVWKNVSDFTHRFAPELFTCGKDGRQDCTE